jgi:hypothetical protein
MRLKTKLVLAITGLVFLVVFSIRLRLPPVNRLNKTLADGASSPTIPSPCGR